MSRGEINNKNIEIFQETGTLDPDERRFTCVLCGKPACIDESYSNQGKNLICWDCKNTRFQDSETAYRWIEGKVGDDCIID